MDNLLNKFLAYLGGRDKFLVAVITMVVAFVSDVVELNLEPELQTSLVVFAFGALFSDSVDSSKLSKFLTNVFEGYKEKTPAVLEKALEQANEETTDQPAAAVAVPAQNQTMDKLANDVSDLAGQVTRLLEMSEGPVD